MRDMASPVDSPSTPGPHYLVAGRYRLRSHLGAGGMGTVWLAFDERLNREVAVKQVISTQGMSEESAETSRQRAMREGRIAAQLSHRNAIAMHDVAVDNGEPWLVMEYLPSKSMDLVLADGPIEPEQAAQIGAQVADAMAEAHAAHIVHRDIKPANILIANSGRNAGLVKITDFGISRAKDELVLTQANTISGTVTYLAPEVARGQDPDELSDVFSLGATLYTMVEGHPPFGADGNHMAVLHRVAEGRITPPTRAGALTPVLLQLLEPSPDRRPTMAEAREMLTSVAASPGISTQQVLTGLISRPLHSGPAATMMRPTPGSGYHSGPYRTEPYSQPSYSAPQYVSGGYSQGDLMPPPPYPPQRQTSPTALALSLLAFFVALTVVLVVLIALLK